MKPHHSFVNTLYIISRVQKNLQLYVRELFTTVVCTQLTRNEVETHLLILVYTVHGQKCETLKISKHCSLKKAKKHFKFLVVTFLGLNFPVCFSLDSFLHLLFGLPSSSCLPCRWRQHVLLKNQGIISQMSILHGQCCKNLKSHNIL